MDGHEFRWIDALPDGAVLIDVRSTREYAAGHPAGAVHVPVLVVRLRTHPALDLFHA